MILAWLLAFSSFLGVKLVPTESSNWTSNLSWQEESNVNVFRAKFYKSEIICPSGKFLVFPRVIHSVQTLGINNIEIMSSGDKTFNEATPFYQKLIYPCEKLPNNVSIDWTVYSYSKFFSRIDSFPQIEKEPNLNSFLSNMALPILFGALFLMSIFGSVIYFGNTGIKGASTLMLGAFIFSGYVGFSANAMIGIKFSMMTAHKLADICLWVGTTFIFYFFRKQNFINKISYWIHAGSTMASTIIILLGKTGDDIQIGTFLPMLPSMLCIFYLSASSFQLILKKDFSKLLLLTSAVVVALSSFYDILNIFGILNFPMTFHFAISLLIIFTSVLVNFDIEKAYKERDDLLKNLENKVTEKTKDLSDALSSLKRSQAELVENARLVSLGTLSAGIAHEINNSINFVHGAIVPLERKVLKVVPENERGQIEKLFTTIKTGTKLTTEIVSSLRKYTGLNQTDLKDFKVIEVINSIQTILKSKLSHIDFVVNCDPELIYSGSHVGINQLLMNLISNAIDALNDKKFETDIRPKIEINCKSLDNSDLRIEVTDNAGGMSDEVKNKIFDPFYTTKSVGKGTGLGLYIVRKEVEKHKGTIQVNSKIDAGTSFIITLPKINLEHTTRRAS